MGTPERYVPHSLGQIARLMSIPTYIEDKKLERLEFNGVEWKAWYTYPGPEGQPLTFIRRGGYDS